MYESNIDSLISDITEKPLYKVMTIFMTQPLVLALMPEEYSSVGKGFICKVDENMADITLTFDGGKSMVSGRLYTDTKLFSYSKYALKSDLNQYVRYYGTASINANETMNIGFYAVDQSSDNTNYPTAVGNGVLLVLSNDNHTMVMQLFSYYDGTSWIRMYWHGTWYSWIKITNE